MRKLELLLDDYIEYCQYWKRLDPKTVKAYRIDLSQYKTYAETTEIAILNSESPNYFLKPFLYVLY